jgi:hypothetical protein
MPAMKKALKRLLVLRFKAFIVRRDNWTDFEPANT